MGIRNTGLGISALVICVISTAAQGYQLEATGAYADYSSPGGDDSAFGIRGEFHFVPVDTGNMPLAEAAFLRRSSNVSVSYVSVDKANEDILSAGFELFQENLYFAAELDSTDPSVSDKTNVLSVRLGFLPTKGLLMTLGYTDFDDVDDTTAVFFGAKYVMPMIGDTAFNIEGNVEVFDDAGDTVIIDVAADYYFNRMFSAGVRVVDTDNDFVNLDTLVGVGARHFFTPMLSGQVEYASQDKDDTWTLYVAARY